MESETKIIIKIENITDHCRVCMVRDENMNSIFDSKDDFIVDWVQFCTGIQFTIEDGLPTQICNVCVQNLTIAHKFKTSCLESEKMFRKILQECIKEEPEFNDFLNNDDDDGDVDIKDEALDNVLNENEKQSRVSIKKEHDSTEEKEIKKPKKVRGPYKKSSQPRKIGNSKRERPKKVRGPYKKSGKPRNVTKTKCEPCNVTFKTRKELYKHKKVVHKDGERWVCEVCGKVFTQQASHYTHMRAHLPPQYACEHCEYKASQKQSLVKHLRIHAGIKLYQCEFCSQSFSQRSTLTAHIRRFHEKAKRFQCPMCDRKFFDKTKLNRHVDSHNEVKRFECELCHSCFAWRCSWKKHLERKHGVQVKANRPGRLKISETMPLSDNSLISKLYAEHKSATEN